MIRGYETTRLSEPESPHSLQWPAALGAGLIAGAVFLIAPRGSPWSTVTFFSPSIMGRTLGTDAGPLILIWVAHLLLSAVYGMIISFVIARMTYGSAFMAGAVMGLVLYGLNLAVVSILWPAMRESELTVIFTHIVFGLIAAGAYRGLLRRRVAA
jgi:hypothetical protein